MSLLAFEKHVPNTQQVHDHPAEVQGEGIVNSNNIL
jgi:hypothetical protein